jgi:hypothetical protein
MFDYMPWAKNEKRAQDAQFSCSVRTFTHLYDGIRARTVQIGGFPSGTRLAIVHGELNVKALHKKWISLCNL